MPGPYDHQETEVIFEMASRLGRVAEGMIRVQGLDPANDLLALVGATHAMVLSFVISKGADKAEHIRIAQKLIAEMTEGLISKKGFDS